MKNFKLLSLLFFIGPILAAFFGMYTVRTMDIPVDVFYPNLIGIIIGIPLVLLMAPRWSDRKPGLVMMLAFVSLVLLLACFLFPGPSEVHRWIMLGPVTLNISMIVLPFILFCLHQMLHTKKFLHGIVLYGATAVILGFQPDAGQATAFGLSALVLFFYNKMDAKLRIGAVLIAITTIFLAWNRVDLLEPVEYVEDIFYLMSALGPIGLIAIFIISLTLFVPFIVMSFRRVETVRVLSIAFIVYLSTSLIITEFGHYPVPVMGAGVSSVLGWFLMLSFVYRPDFKKS
jgi:cell division protein FtsW (lipid II flippase)